MSAFDNSAPVILFDRFAPIIGRRQRSVTGISQICSLILRMRYEEPHGSPI